jgi:hypothetical protein
MDVFCGIDVAFAKGKRLPLCVCKWEDGTLIPIRVPVELEGRTPRGSGNKASLEPSIVERFANEVAWFLETWEKLDGCKIKRIAIDAPSSSRLDRLSVRRAEAALGELNISYFKTPSNSEFADIKAKALAHFLREGKESHVPNANKLWMLVGFALFRRLRQSWECIEVYPQATMRSLGVASVHKSKPEGLNRQLHALLRKTRWMPFPCDQALNTLKAIVRAPAHDVLDSYACAWLAALEEPHRIRLGSVEEDDAIWIPADENH